MASSNNRGSWLLLALAAAFCVAIVVVKREQIFGPSREPAPGPSAGPSGGSSVDSSKSGPNGPTSAGTAPGGTAKPTEKPIDPNAPRIAVRVLADTTGKPIAGARVVTMTRQATALSDDTTDANGEVTARPSGGRMHGAVAFHADYEICAKLANESGIELRLRPVERFEVRCNPSNAAQREWQKHSNHTLKILYDPNFNPVRADEPYLAHRMYTHLGLVGREWPLTGEKTELPRYLNTSSKVVMYARQKSEKRLDATGIRKPRPVPAADVAPIQVTHSKLPQSARFVDLPLQETPHMVVLRYDRDPQDKRTLMLSLSCVSRDLKDEKLGMVTAVTHDKTAYEESNGTATFRIWDLHRNAYQPTLILVEPGKPVRTQRCNPVEVDGVTEAKLTPYAPGSITIRLKGARDEATAQSDVKLEIVHLLEDHLVPASEFPTIDLGKREFRFSSVPPMTYRVFARGPNHVSTMATARVQPGKHTDIELEMLPLCRVQLVVSPKTDATSMKFRRIESKTERSVDRYLWDRLFIPKREGELVRLTSRNHLLDLPFGTYEFTLQSTQPTTQRVVLNSPTQEIRLGLDK